MLEDLEVPCGFCGVYNRVERVFCLKCRSRLIPLTVYDLVEDDYVYPGDRDNLRALEGSKLLLGIAKRFIAGRRERVLREWLGGRAVRVEPFSELDMIVRECGNILAVEKMPELYVIGSDVINALTFGDDNNPVMAITSSALRELTREELMAVVSHELAHVKSKHLTYHTLAELLVRGANFIAPLIGVGVISSSLQMLLLAWYRESEITADRAALLVVQDIEIMKNLMRKITRNTQVNKGLLSEVDELFKTHPNYEKRLEKLVEFYNSEEYKRAVEKIKRRRELAKALIPVCIHCKEPRPVSELFYPKCGKSQL